MKNSTKDYIVFLAIFFLGVVLIQLFWSIILRRLKAWAERTQTTIDDILMKIVQKAVVPLFYYASFYISQKYLILPESFHVIIYKVGIILFVLLVIRFLVGVITYGIQLYIINKKPHKDQEHNIRKIIIFIKVIIWVGGIIFLLDDIGVKIFSLVAGLGLSTILIALATKEIL